MTDWLIVDAHVHTYPTKEVGQQVAQIFERLYRVRFYCTGTVEEYLQAMEESGTKYGVTLGLCPSVNQLKNMNFWTCAVARKYPQLIPFISVDLKMKGRTPVEEIEHKLKWGVRGIKLHPIAQEFFPNDRRMWPVYKKCEELRLPIVFHSGKAVISRPVEYAEPRLFAEVLENFPRLTVVLAHLGAGFCDQALELARQYPDVYFDTSIAITGEENKEITQARGKCDLFLSDEEAMEMIEEIGADRILFGSDFPCMNPRFDIERIKRLPLSEESKRNILGENAMRVFEIGV